MQNILLKINKKISIFFILLTVSLLGFSNTPNIVNLGDYPGTNTSKSSACAQALDSYCIFCTQKGASKTFDPSCDITRIAKACGGESTSHQALQRYCNNNN